MMGAWGHSTVSLPTSTTTTLTHVLTALVFVVRKLPHSFADQITDGLKSLVPLDTCQKASTIIIFILSSVIFAASDTVSIFVHLH
jgi:hypothetical protein